MLRLDAIEDRLSAAFLKGLRKGSVHTKTGVIGKLVQTSVLRGTATIETENGPKTVPAREVGDLDTPLS